jgi:dTMP kinase
MVQHASAEERRGGFFYHRTFQTLPDQASLARARNAAAPHCETRLDDESIEFHKRVWEAYHELARSEPERVKVVDGRAGLDTIEHAVWAIVSQYV